MGIDDAVRAADHADASRAAAHAVYLRNCEAFAVPEVSRRVRAWAAQMNLDITDPEFIFTPDHVIHGDGWDTTQVPPSVNATFSCEGVPFFALAHVEGGSDGSQFAFSNFWIGIPKYWGGHIRTVEELGRAVKEYESKRAAEAATEAEVRAVPKRRWSDWLRR
jgi:hypothetical protein